MARNRFERGGRRRAPEMNRYTRKTLHRDREYGLYWYAWLWKTIRPVLVLICSLVVVVGLVATGWMKINESFLMAVEPGNAETIDFVIENGELVSTVANNLSKQGLVRNPSIFKYIVQFQGLTANLQAGNYPLSKDMDVMQVVEKLTEGSASNERTITIIPGWTIDEAADYLKRTGAIKDTAEFLSLSNNLEKFEEQSYALEDAAKMGTLQGRKYQLEGYLAPDTYRVYTNATAEDIIKRLVQQTDTVRDEVFNAPPPTEVVRDETGEIVYDNLDEEGNPIEQAVFTTTLNNDQTFILASIIEKEAGIKSDFAKVAAVFHNRIERGMRLESDATAAYPLGIDRMILTSDELSSVNGYNTYTKDGLPVGPICNPSKAALQAALYPNTDYIYDGYLYFCAGDPEKNELVFAKTREEHLANVAKYRPLWVQHDERAARTKAAGGQ